MGFRKSVRPGKLGPMDKCTGMRHNGTHPGSFLGEVGNPVKIGMWGLRRLLFCTGW